MAVQTTVVYIMYGNEIVVYSHMDVKEGVITSCFMVLEEYKRARVLDGGQGSTIWLFLALLFIAVFSFSVLWLF